jgi:hypothetical protein
MTTRRFAAVLAGVLLATAGCGTSQSPRGGQPTTFAASPSPTIDASRDACHRVSVINDEGNGIGKEIDPAVSLPVADVAKRASNPGIATAGGHLADAFVASPSASQVDMNLNAARAFLELATACGSLYGDGPW